MDTVELVKKAKKGDEDAFYRLVESRKENIYKIAYSYVKNKEDALDIVSEAIYKAFTSIKGLKQPKYFNTWFTRILINCAINQTKKNKKILPLDNSIIEEQGIRDVGISREESMDLYSAIDILEEKQKTIVILKYFEGFTLTEIAEILKCPLGTVKTRLNKALKDLRAKLGEV